MLRAPNSRADRFRWWCIASVVAAGAWAYHNSFAVPFLFDDQHAILQNPHLRSLHAFWSALPKLTRPVVDLSLALNYAIGGERVAGYHLFNLTVHLLAALALFGLTRRTVESPRGGNMSGSAAAGIAVAIALLWVVHPLHTQSVTYLVQRAEALMGLWYLLVLYSLCRSASTRHPGRWQAAAVCACALGMGSKAVMVTAPVAALLYDRVFLAGSFREAWRARRALYLGLGATWLLLLMPAVVTLSAPEPTVGLTANGVTPIAYGLTQPSVLLHYLRLSVWPHPLCLDYAWPVARAAADIVPPMAAVTLLALGVAWLWRRRPAAGFLGLMCFLLLSPTSTIVPISDVAMEHRMYLPLAPLIALCVLCGRQGLMYVLPMNVVGRRAAAVSLIALLTACYGCVTIRRNMDYRSAAAIWSQTVAVRPANARAHTNLGLALQGAGHRAAAMERFREAIRLDPLFTPARNNLGVALVEAGQPDAAVPLFQDVLRRKPQDAQAHNNLGVALVKLGRLEEAISHYRDALRHGPDSAEVHNNFGRALARQGRHEEAVAHYRDALRLDPTSSSAHNSFGLTLAEQGKPAEAIPHYLEAIRLKPENVEALNNLANALARRGEFEEAIRRYHEALRIKPDYATVSYNLAKVLARQGRLEEAAERFAEAIRLSPASSEAHNGLGNVLARQGKLDEAIARYQEALRLHPDNAEAHYNVSLVLVEQGKIEPARRHLAEAMRLDPALTMPPSLGELQSAP